MTHYIPQPFTDTMAKDEVNKLYRTKRARYKDLYKQGYSQRRIGLMYGVSQMTIWLSLRTHNKPQETIRKVIERNGSVIDFVR